MWEWLNFGYDDQKETSPNFKECSKYCNKEYIQEEPPTTVPYTSLPPWVTEKDVNLSDTCCSPECMYSKFEGLLATKTPTPPPQITTSNHDKKIEEQKDEKIEKKSELQLTATEDTDKAIEAIKAEPSKEVAVLAKPELQIKSTAPSFSSPPPPTSLKSICKRKKASTYFPRFIMTVLEALRDLKQLEEEDEGHSFRDIIRYVKENFIVDGDVEAQVKTALRLAHVSGLVVYLSCYRSYRLTTTAIEDMGVSKKRYERFLRRRREVGNIDPTELQNKARNCNTALCNTSICEGPSSEAKKTDS